MALMFALMDWISSLFGSKKRRIVAAPKVGIGLITGHF
jgi:hypothetical protein